MRALSYVSNTSLLSFLPLITWVATMSMMAKAETLERYKVDEFDWICIDEVHRAGSESYQKIMNYFQPDFWLGMTASPERTDGFDIFNLFDHNIAYEIRLQHALKEDLLCPFHYFGITDIEIDGETVDDKTDLRNFSYLVSDTRARYILEQANYFGHSGERVKGLIFCSGKKEAQELSMKFNEYGYYTTVLTGANSEKEREKAINLLTREISTDEIEKHEKDICNHVKNDTDEMPFLDYIFTIDIFNEGVDIPEINQVLMLRPTESPIVFVQQLGRGLRKAEGKEYVVIIDFIGNYTNNYMIPIALSGDRSYNKDSIRRYVSEGTRIIPGASTIHFDEISRKRIFQSIDSARTNDVKLLRESFEQLKYRMGRIPSILDFRKYGSIDVNKYFVKFDSYYAFLVKYYSDEYKVRLTPEEASIIEFLSKKVTNMKRIYELALLQQLLQQRRRVSTYYEKTLEMTYHKKLNLQTEESVVRNLTNEFPKEEERKKYKDCILIKKSSEGYVLEDKFEKMLNENLEFLKMVDELIQYGIENYQENYSDSYKDTDFQLYQKYTYEDVCRLLNWQRNMNAQNIGGYFYDATTKTLPVFINYDKAEDAIAYEDRFVTRENLIALSKHPRKVNSSDADHFFKKTESDKENKILLFVRKNKDDNQYNYRVLSEELYITSRSYPFEKKPFISNMVGRKTSKSDIKDIIEIVDDKCQFEQVLPYLKIEKLINETGELFFDKKVIASDEAIKKYNGIVDSWEQKKGFMINEKEGIVSIDAYESTTLYIMQKLLELSHAYDREQQKYNEKYLRECGMEFEDELKRNAMVDCYDGMYKICNKK